MNSFKKKNQLFKYLEKKDPKSLISISDIEIKYFEGETLSEEEEKALNKFKSLRIQKLNSEKVKSKDFNKKYEYFRNVSNLIDYRDLLNGTIKI